MKKSTLGVAMGSLLSAGGVVWAVTAFKNRKNDTIVVNDSFKALKDTDMRDSVKIDKMKSVDANKDSAEKGLTQYDHTLREEWVANGFPQTHAEMEELETQGK